MAEWAVRYGFGDEWPDGVSGRQIFFSLCFQFDAVGAAERAL
jgi:hypothetical protein